MAVEKQAGWHYVFAPIAEELCQKMDAVEAMGREIVGAPVWVPDEDDEDVENGGTWFVFHRERSLDDRAD